MRVSRLHRIRFGAVATAAVSAFALAGCGTTTIDNGKLEAKAKSDLEKTGATDVSVSCPSNVTAKQGQSFTCTATCKDPSGKSHSGTFTVQQVSNSGDVTFAANCVSGSGSASGNSGNSGSSGSSGNSGNSGSGTTTT